MYTLHYSPEKNRIYLKLEGLLSEQEFNNYKNEIIGLMDNSKKGFTVVADLQTCDFSVVQNSDNFNVIREYGLQKGLKDVACVLSADHFDKYEKGLTSNIRNPFLTLAEADAFHDNK